MKKLFLGSIHFRIGGGAGQSAWRWAKSLYKADHGPQLQGCGSTAEIASSSPLVESCGLGVNETL